MSENDRQRDAVGAETAVHPWDEIRTTGLLWLINTTVFHPRGYALGFHRDADGNAVGWSLKGDGTEPFIFSDVGLPEGMMTIDDCFAAVKELLK